MMSKIRKRTGVIFSLLLLTAIQMFNTACSRKLFRDSSTRTPQVMPHQNPDKDSLKYFAKAATEEIKEASETVITNPSMISGNDVSCNVQDFRTCGDEIINLAMKYIGLPYCYGGLGKKCIDCSGFVLRVFGEMGISLPHNAQAQSKYGTVVKSRDELVKGDIVFFKNSYKTSNFITHAGIYNGNNMFVHASSGNGVTITSMDDSWWKKKFVFGARVLQ
ncbi:MAG TPA: C40 family peptidase [Bacteroidales bacterium]|nr:C40 family peptidase [Bacteroidales bacterium]